MGGGGGGRGRIVWWVGGGGFGRGGIPWAGHGLKPKDGKILKFSLNPKPSGPECSLFLAFEVKGLVINGLWVFAWA